MNCDHCVLSPASHCIGEPQQLRFWSDVSWEEQDPCPATFFLHLLTPTPFFPFFHFQVSRRCCLQEGLTVTVTEAKTRANASKIELGENDDFSTGAIVDLKSKKELEELFRLEKKMLAMRSFGESRPLCCELGHTMIRIRVYDFIDKYD
jgi:hypothetical protein